MKVKIIAVLGAGTMGSDVALDLAVHDYDVILKDRSEDALKRARDRIRQNFKLFKILRKDWGHLSVDSLLPRITFTLGYENFELVDMVIENITEDIAAKESLYRELGGICRADVLYGVNTSCIPITRISEILPKPENVIGLHFLNPVPLKKLVEVILGKYTSEETLALTKVFLESLGKTWAVVKDSPGFVTNRVLMLTINECAALVEEGIAGPGTIDTIFTQGFSHKMGPLATADLIGLDTILASLKVLCTSFEDPKFKPSPLLEKMVQEGLLGKKSGKGFFVYKS